jgi:hypothetical protein
MNANALRPGCATLRPDLAACFAIARTPRNRRDSTSPPAPGILAELAKYGRP